MPPLFRRRSYPLPPDRSHGYDALCSAAAQRPAARPADTAVRRRRKTALGRRRKRRLSAEGAGRRGSRRSGFRQCAAKNGARIEIRRADMAGTGLGVGARAAAIVSSVAVWLAGCGPERGRIVMDSGEGAPDSMVLDVVGFLLDKDMESWKSHLPSDADLAAATKGLAKGVQMPGWSEASALGQNAGAIRNRAAESLARSREFLALCGISARKDISCRALIWGRPWKSAEASGAGEYAPDIEIEAPGRRAYFSVARVRAGSRWVLLGVEPAGYFEHWGGLASVRVCFAPFRRDPRGLPESPRRGPGGEIAGALRPPEFEMEFRYDVRGPIPDPARLLDMHRAWIVEMNHIIRPFADRAASGGGPIRFGGRDEVFAHFSAAIHSAPEAIRAAREGGASETSVREMEFRNNMSLLWIVLRRCRT